MIMYRQDGGMIDVSISCEYTSIFILDATKRETDHVRVARSKFDIQ